MSTSLRSRRHPRGRRLLGLAASLAVIATFLVPFAIDPTPALADPSTQIGSGVECANDNWQAETTADNAGHVYVFYTNYCSNHDFLFYQVSNDGGQTFGPAQTLCSALGVACTAAAATHTIAGGGYKTEDDPSLFVESLGRAVGVSRSVLAARFAEMVGHPPMHYLTLWRMQLASRLLVEGGQVAAVAGAVGYESEAAFSRAFKKLVGQAPATWRREAVPAPSNAPR